MEIDRLKANGQRVDSALKSEPREKPLCVSLLARLSFGKRENFPSLAFCTHFPVSDTIACACSPVQVPCER